MFSFDIYDNEQVLLLQIWLEIVRSKIRDFSIRDFRVIIVMANGRNPKR